jgi:hypothetical protein
MAEVAPVDIEAEVFDRYAVKSPALKEGDQVVVRGNEYMRGPGPVVIMPSSRPPEGEVTRKDAPATSQPAVPAPAGESPQDLTNVNQDAKEAAAAAASPSGS